MDMQTEGRQLALQKGSRSASAPVSVAEFLTFRMGAEECGIDILRVQEIRPCEAPTRIANALSFIKGVVSMGLMKSIPVRQ